MLEIFFRKYAWTANLVVLLAAAWLLAKTVNTLVGAAIRPRPEAELSAPAPVSARPVLRATLDPERLYRLIGVTPPAEQPEEEAAAARGPQNCADASARPVRTSLRVQLVASVLAERPQWSLATVADLGTRENRILAVGDEIQGARMIAVERMRDERDATGNGFKVVAVFCNGGTKEYVESEGGGVEAAPSLGVASLPRPQAPGGPAPAEGVTKVSDHSYQIARNTIDQALTNMNTLATQARIVPSFKNGVANGFKLFSIQPGSLYASIGIENGDVIQRVNGYEINSPDKALEVYQRLRESSHVTIELERGGQVIRKEYNVVGQ